MLDGPLRARTTSSLQAVAGPLARHGVTPGAVTAAGLAAGVGACVAAALAVWPLALALWLANRLLDAVDGAVARASGGGTDLGGFLDFLADFVVYGGFVLGVAIALPDARVACCALLAVFLLNTVALLSFASLAGKRGLGVGDDDRSLRFTVGAAEATETTVAYVALCLLPAHAATVAWVFAGLVAVTVLQRIALARRTLG